MAEVEKLIEIYKRLEDAGLMVIAGKKDSAELMVSNDVVPVVRCKDCKHWSYIPGLDKEPHCTVFCGLHSKAYPTDPDDYCSHGERKDNGAE